MHIRLIAGSLSVVLGASASWAQPLGTAFTYQGRLKDAGSPASGLHDLRFRLYDAAAGGAQVGLTDCADDVSVTDGLFTVPLDFGAQFAGQQRFLEIEVRTDTGLDCGDETGYIALTPRQLLTAAPNALFSLNAANASTATTATSATNATQLNGQPATFYTNAANLASGTIDAARFPLPLALAGSNANAIIRATNTGTGVNSAALFGLTSSASGVTNGVFGQSDSSDGNGVYGLATATSGGAWGIYGQTNSIDGLGGYFTGPGDALWAVTTGVGKSCVVGLHQGTADGFGLYGQTNGTTGAGVFGRVYNTTGPTHGGLFVDYSTSGTGAAGYAFAASGFTYGLYGQSGSASGTGVYGQATAGSGAAFGGRFISASTTGMGVYAEAIATTGVALGGQFVSDSTSGTGVSGLAPAATGSTAGGFFQSNSSSGSGVIGNAFATSGTTYGGFFLNQSTGGTGVLARVTQPGGVALRAEAPAGGTAALLTGGNVGIGTSAPLSKLHVDSGADLNVDLVLNSGVTAAKSSGIDFFDRGTNKWSLGKDDTNSFYVTESGMGQRLLIQPGGNMVLSPATGGKVSLAATATVALDTTTTSNASNAAAVSGRATASGGLGGGVRGTSDGTSGRGVIGVATSSTGSTTGVSGQSNSSAGRGVSGAATSTSGTTTGVYGSSNSPSGRGVFGEAFGATGQTIGVSGASYSTAGLGVYGLGAASSGGNFGGYFESASTTGQGVHGVAFATSGLNYGVVGETLSAGGYGVYSLGRFAATGTKAFRIDHPDDPANKYLQHYCAESPEVINFYRGTVTLDGAGQAVVELPHYFAKINKTPSYQLTAVGAPMPRLHVAGKISEAALRDGAKAEPGQSAPVCSFRIAGGAPGGEVSWRVEALRNDRWVQQRGAPVEVEKQGLEKGTYQHPELYGQPAEKGVSYGAERERRLHERPSPPTLPDATPPASGLRLPRSE